MCLVGSFHARFDLCNCNALTSSSVRATRPSPAGLKHSQPSVEKDNRSQPTWKERGPEFVCNCQIFIQKVIVIIPVCPRHRLWKPFAAGIVDYDHVSLNRKSRSLLRNRIVAYGNNPRLQVLLLSMTWRRKGQAVARCRDR